MRKRGALLVLVCFTTCIILTGCLDKMPRVTFKAENLESESVYKFDDNFNLNKQ